MGVPKDLASHYAAYNLTGTPFQATVQVMDDGMPHKTASVALFASVTDATKQHHITVDNLDAQARAIITDDDLARWSRSLLWELLSPAFQQDTYPQLVTEKAMKLAVAVANRTAIVNEKDYIVNPPYTPKIKTLTFDYVASVLVNLNDDLYHIQPFGYVAVEPDVDDLFALLPQYNDEGELYIGLTGVDAPQELSLLFQLAEETPNPDTPPPPIQWSYLSANHWHTIDILADHTVGLLTSGIISFNLPVVQSSTLLPGDLYWLRAAIAHSSAGVSDVIGIHTQAVAKSPVLPASFARP